MKKIIDNLFIDHPQAVNETYFEHMGQALYFSFNMCLGFFVCFCHAFIPGAFEKTGSQLVTKLYDRMVQNRMRHQAKQDTSIENTKPNRA
ncbi:DUF6356 family protein [Kiloniella sp.]|uniref:DUF6356 family protein n=1 Tax=Kiloniella sp. TaxID=1938587 RepID=UPI003A95C7C0